ncbi:MAG TPA: phosphoribosylamine--glycine ligase [Deltaproteobacteria bacterium]|nr:phosphoribosylamine--glycine ligase [Deltaproteobacteria bacterium]
MKVLVVGGGGREHALCWKISQSPRVAELYCAPGNGGIGRIANIVEIGAEDIEGLLRFAKDRGIDLTVVGPEAPLVEGIVDAFESEGLRIFGPRKAAAEIEGSKAFAKDFMSRHGIPTAPYRTFTDPWEAMQWVRALKWPVVVKASGLAAGKGSIVCEDEEQAVQAIELIMLQKAFGEAGDQVVVEDRLWGEEASFIAFTDGETVLPMPSSQDHKPVFDGDRGPNTGGMGAYSPAPVITPELEERILREIMIPAVKGLKEEGRPYKGVLYAGLMIDEDQNPWVLEFNCRFGDPETQPLIVRMKGDIVRVMEACIEGRLKSVSLSWDPRPSVCVVMASGGYPGPYEKGKEIHGLEEAERMADVWVFHAGTSFRNGRFFTSGGRVLGVTGMGESLPEAIRRTYEAVKKIHWEGVHYRRDIGQKALKRIGAA